MDYNNLITEVISHYNIGKLKNTVIEELQDKENNLLLKFETSKGIFLLKNYSDNKHNGNTQRLKKNLAFAAGLLFENEIPVPLCLTKDKMPYLELKGYLYSIDKFIEGSTIIDKTDDLRLMSVARLLAKLHRSTRTEIKEPLKPYEFNNIKRIEKIGNYFDLVEKRYRSEQNEVDKTILDMKEFILSEVRDLNNTINKIKPRKFISLIHGDFQPRQVIINDLNISYLIDYETMNQNFSEYEFSRGLFLFSKFDEGELDLDSANLFIKEYKKEFGLDFEINIDEILGLIRHSILTLFGIVLQHFSKARNSGGALKHFYEKLKWIRNNESLFREKLKI